MTKPIREQFRSDKLTAELQSALQEKFKQQTGKNVKKSEIYRSAIFHLAKAELSEKEFQAILLAASDETNHL